MRTFRTFFITLLLGSLALPLFAAQLDSPYSALNIQQKLNKLKVLGNVLYIAAHPDDENTRLLAYLSRGRLLNTAYLSLTRGSGGQNLLGKEKGDLLGVIRTQELLAARQMDGARQFFTRAVDFGYSKSISETMSHWQHDSLLADVVRVIRTFHPDVIITRFAETRGGHGHHLSSALLAKEAFSAAGDPKAFPKQLYKLQPWQARRLVWNSWPPSGEVASIEVGGYNPLLGLSYPEIAARGRSMHKSQGFGASPGFGPQTESFEWTAGDSLKANLFSGIDLTWKRLPGSRQIEESIDAIIESFDPADPSASVAALVELYKEMKNRPHHFLLSQKMAEVQDIIRLACGLHLEATVQQESITAGQELDVRAMLVNRSPVPLNLTAVRIPFAGTETVINKTARPNQPVTISEKIVLPQGTPLSSPFWLKLPHEGGMYRANPGEQIIRPQSRPVLTTTFSTSILGQDFDFSVAVNFHKTDAVKGNVSRPVVILPELSVSADQSVMIFPKTAGKSLTVRVTAHRDSVAGKLFLRMPAGWRAEPAATTFFIAKKDMHISAAFTIYPQPAAGDGDLQVVAETEKQSCSNDLFEISYPHIQAQTVLLPARVRLVRLAIEYQPFRLGYIMGSGDEIPEALRQLDFEVDLLSDGQLDEADLSRYSAIVCGVRAFNTRKGLDQRQQRLIEYVREGGTWVVQHNTRFGLRVEQIGPFPFTASGRNRIAEEDAPIKILDPDHPLMNYPNRITQEDFDGWIQERGLYFADSWDEKLIPLLAGHDEDEPDRPGGLLYARYGKGVFIFTAYSWFRQLPAGVPGAYRLFINLISARGTDE